MRGGLLGVAAALVIASAPRVSEAQRGPAEKAAPPLHHTLRVDSHPISIWEKRPAHPKASILLIHGRTWSSLPDFDLQVPGERLSVMDALAARGYDVYAIDLRGYGATPRDSTGWLTPDRAAADVAAALEWVQRRSPYKDRPALVGWSLGSLVAQLVAERNPQLLSALVLFGRPVRDTLFAPDSSAGSPPRRRTTAEAAASDFIAPGAISRRAIDAYVSQALAADSIRADWRRLHDFDALDASRVKVPTLLMIGQLDPFYAERPAAQAELFVRLGNPDKEWVVLPGGDHAALIERTAPRFVQAIASFLERPTR